MKFNFHKWIINKQIRSQTKHWAFVSLWIAALNNYLYYDSKDKLWRYRVKHSQPEEPEFDSWVFCMFCLCLYGFSIFFSFSLNQVSLSTLKTPFSSCKPPFLTGSEAQSVQRRSAYLHEEAIPPALVTGDNARTQWLAVDAAEPFVTQVLPHKNTQSQRRPWGCSPVMTLTGSQTRCSRCDPVPHLVKIQRWHEPHINPSSRHMIKVTTSTFATQAVNTIPQICLINNNGAPSKNRISTWVVFWSNLTDLFGFQVFLWKIWKIKV